MAVYERSERRRGRKPVGLFSKDRKGPRVLSCQTNFESSGIAHSSQQALHMAFYAHFTSTQELQEAAVA
jgi:hypothetical protein